MNKRLNIVFLLGLIVSQHLSAQSNKDTSKTEELTSFLKFQLSWNSGFIWEQKTGNKSVIDFFGGLKIGRQSDKIYDPKAKIIVSPASYIEYKFYYNFFKRLSNQKKTINNSSDFIFGKIENLYPVKNQNLFNLLFIEGWGAQRTFWRKFLIDYHVGIIEHFYFDKPPSGGFKYVKLEPLAEFGFSYVF